MESDKKLRVVVTGATGMVSEGVLHECLLSDKVAEVLIVNRRPSEITHSKLTEIIHNDFYNLSAIEDKLSGYDACFFCLGVSSIGMKEPAYYQKTYTLTLHVAETLLKHNKAMTFCYVSGRGTDSTEKGNSMWARVKGKTENDLMKLGLKQVFAFRPGYMHPTKGLKRVLPAVKYLSWLYPVLKVLFTNGTNTLKDVGLAMINVAIHGYNKSIIDPKDIEVLARL